MSLHISRFLDRIKTAESRQQRDVVMTVNEARDLHADITKLLLRLDQATAPSTKTVGNNEISITGGTF